MKTLIVGLGNPILTDDGVGVKAAYAIAGALAAWPEDDVTVTEACVGGLRLMELMVGYDRVILIDALTYGDQEPGSIQRLTLSDLEAISPTQHSASTHDTTLVTALETGRAMGLSLPAEVIIYGVGAENVIDFSDEPTPAVEAAIPQVVKIVMQELELIR